MDKFTSNVSIEETSEYQIREMQIEMEKEDKPEQGKIYSLFGGKGEACIAAGNTWAESEVKNEKDTDIKMPFPDALDQHQIMKKGIVRSE
mgnify:CR=1 FL=1